MRQVDVVERVAGSLPTVGGGGAPVHSRQTASRMQLRLVFFIDVVAWKINILTA